MVWGYTAHPLPHLEDIHWSRCSRRACNIMKDTTHPCYSLFSPLPSGERYRLLNSHTARLRNSFYPLANTELTECCRTDEQLAAISHSYSEVKQLISSVHRCFPDIFKGGTLQVKQSCANFLRIWWQEILNEPIFVLKWCILNLSFVFCVLSSIKCVHEICKSLHSVTETLQMF